MTCEHKNFASLVGVARLTKMEDGPVIGYAAEIRIKCADCEKSFRFLGLAPGSDSHGARASVDGLEARLAIYPEGEQPTSDRICVNINLPAGGTLADEPADTPTEKGPLQ